MEGDSQILGSDADSGLTRWDLKTGRLLSRTETDQSEMTAIIPLPRRKLVATVGSTGAQLRDAETLECRQLLPPFLDRLQGSAAAAPDETSLVAGTATGKVVVWDSEFQWQTDRSSRAQRSSECRRFLFGRRHFCHLRRRLLHFALGL